MRITTKQIGTLAASISLFLSSTALQAGGFGVTVQSASGGGNAATGYTMAEDASSMWYNPALLSSVKGTQISGGVSYTDADVSVTNKGSELPVFSVPVQGDDTASPANSAAIPNFYFKTDINEDLAFGLGISVPFGVNTEYDEDSFARYEATESGLTVININPAISWKYTERLHFGAGLNIQSGDAVLARSVDGALACAQVPGADCSGFSGNSNQDTDTQVEITASDVAYGFNIGLAYHPDDITSLSLSYRSAVKFDLEGDADFDHDELANLGEATLAAVGLSDQDATASLEMPASLSMGIASRVNDKLTIHGDLTWTEWSSIPEIRVKFPDHPQASPASDSVTELKWNNTVRVGIGMAYELTEDTKLRAGIASDPTPTPSAENRTPRAPSADTTWYSVGVGQKIDDNFSLDVSLSLIDLDDYTINYRSPDGYLTRANVETQAYSAALSLNYKFK